MLTTYEEEVEDLLNQIKYLFENKDKLNDETKAAVRKLSILFMIDLHEYLKANDYKTYENLIEAASKE